jgi:hypothetical protein
MIRKYIPVILLLLIVGYYVYNFFYKRNQLSKLHYGVKANSLREILYIPIIDDYMKATESGPPGSRWESKGDLPKGNTALHVWKTITPLSDTAGLYEESDAFRKRFNDSLVYQLNINSKISGDTIANRKGQLFFYSRSSLPAIDINDDKIDSIARSWGLTYLIRKQ